MRKASILLAGLAGLAATPVFGQQACRPELAITEVRFSPMRTPTSERRWSAVLAVDASRCATTSGRFEIGFARLKENGPDLDFHETFTWKPSSVEVSVDFWADEAVSAYWLHTVAPCPCRE